MTKRKTARSSQRRKGQELYAARLRAVQPLVTFALRKRAPSGYDKRKLKKYHDYLFGTIRAKRGETTRAGIAQGLRVKVARKDPKKLAKIRRELGQDELAGIKYAFVPTYLDPATGRPMKATVRDYRDSATVITLGSVGMIYGQFDKRALSRNAEQECRRLMDELESQLPRGSVVRFKIQCDDKMTFQNYTRDELPGEISFFTTGKYRHTWKEWLNGLVCEFAPTERKVIKHDQTIELQRDIRKKIYKIRLDWMLALEALEGMRGAGPVEGIARASTGDTRDARTRVTMQELRKAGHVVGDDNKWMLTPSGRAYLKHGRDILPLYRRK